MRTHKLNENIRTKNADHLNIENISALPKNFAVDHLDLIIDDGLRAIAKSSQEVVVCMLSNYISFTLIQSHNQRKLVDIVLLDTSL